MMRSGFFKHRSLLSDEILDSAIVTVFDRMSKLSVNAIEGGEGVWVRCLIGPNGQRGLLTVHSLPSLVHQLEVALALGKKRSWK